MPFLAFYCLQNLEQLLDSYLGCVLVVSHDKAFMTNVVNSMFVLEGDGVVRKFNGRYEEYLDYMEQRLRVRKRTAEAAASIKGQRSERDSGSSLANNSVSTGVGLTHS